VIVDTGSPYCAPVRGTTLGWANPLPALAWLFDGCGGAVVRDGGWCGLGNGSERAAALEAGEQWGVGVTEPSN